MKKFKNIAITVLGMIILTVVFSTLIPTISHGQGGTISKDVNVVNTPSVNVANPVGLATGATVGINPSNNTVKLDATVPVTVRGEETVAVFNALYYVEDVVTVGPVEVSAFKEIRVIAVREYASSNNCGAMITPYVRYGNEWYQKSPLDTDHLNNMNKNIDVPGQMVEFSLRQNGSSCGGPEGIRIVIYGRRN